MNNTVGDGNGYVGDVGLDPESAWTGSATWRWTSADGHDRVELTPFYTQVDDYIDAVPTSGFRDNQFNVLRYANQSARLWGLNAAGQMRLGETERFGSFDIGARLEWQRGENRDSNESLYQQMPANAAFNLTQARGAWSSTLSNGTWSMPRHAFPTCAMRCKLPAMDCCTCVPRTAGPRCASMLASRTCSTATTICHGSVAPCSAAA